MISKKVYDNFTLNGSLNIGENGVTSATSTSNYLLVVAVPSWASGSSILFHIKTGTSTSSSYYILGYPDNTSSHRTFQMTTSVFYAYGSTGSSVASFSGLGLSASTEYWIRLSWNGSTYTLEKSTDGTTYTTVGTYSSSTAINVNQKIVFGYSYGNSSQAASFYLADCYTKNAIGQYVWTPWTAISTSGSIVVTEGYYNTGTNIYTPPFKKEEFGELLKNQTILSKNDLYLRVLGNSQYDYVLSNGTPGGTYSDTIKVKEGIYTSPGKDYLLDGEQTQIAFELDGTDVKNSNTGWFYDNTNETTYDLYKTIGKDITALFQGQEKDETNTLYIVNQKVNPLTEEYIPGFVAGTFTSAKPSSTPTNYKNVVTSSYTFIKKDGALYKTTNGFDLTQVDTTGFSNTNVVTDGSSKVLIYDNTANTYLYSTNGGETFTSGTASGLARIQGAIIAGSYCIITNGQYWYSSSDFTTWTNTNLSTQSVRMMTYANGYYVLSFSGNSTVYVTTDFTSFQIVTLPDTLYREMVSFNGAFYGLCSTAGYMKSSDGSNWTQAGTISGSEISVCGGSLFIKGLDGVYTLLRSDDGETWNACTGIASVANTEIPAVSIGNDVVLTSVSQIMYHGTGSSFSDVSILKDFTIYTSPSTYPLEQLPDGGFLVFGGPATGGIFVIPGEMVRSTITASSDPTQLSEDYMDYKDSGYTVTLNAGLDTIVSVQEAS